jgi:hypothetical protein
VCRVSTRRVGARFARLAILVCAAAAVATLQIASATAQVAGPGAGQPVAVQVGSSPPPASPGSSPAPAPGQTGLGAGLFVESMGHIAQQTSQVGLTGIQQQIWSIEDRLQGRHPAASQPLGFVEGASAEDPGSVVDSAFAALGYSGEPRDPKSPILIKAPQPEPSHFSYSAWTQGFVDYENRSGTFLGTDIGRNTFINGGLAGADVTVQGVTSASDAFVIGLLTGDVQANIRNGDGSTAHVDGPSLGAYTAYVNGAFSADGTFKTDFFDLSDAASLGVIIPLRLNNYVAAGNVNYKQDFGSWWVQPTAGAIYTRTVWDQASKSLGMDDGTDVRVQGGARLGSSFDWQGVHYSETLTLLAYDDVVISGGTLAVATGIPMAPTDEGKIFGQAIGRLDAQLTSNWSVNVEGELRGRADVYGIAGRVGVTCLFN